MRAHRARGGASAIEFAILLPVILILVSGIVDMAWYLHQQSLVVGAVREGARSGSAAGVSGTPDVATTAIDRTRAVLTTVHVPIDTANVTAAVTNLRTGGTCDTNDTVTVTAVVPSTRLIGIVPVPATISGSLAMRISGADCR